MNGQIVAHLFTAVSQYRRNAYGIEETLMVSKKHLSDAPPEKAYTKYQVYNLCKALPV